MLSRSIVRLHMITLAWDVMLSTLTIVSTCACAIVKTALLPALFNTAEEDKTWSLAQLCLWAP